MLKKILNKYDRVTTVTIGLVLGLILSIGFIAIAAELPPLSNFDTGKVLQSADLKSLFHKVEETDQSIASLMGRTSALETRRVHTAQMAHEVFCCSRTWSTPMNTTVDTVFKITATGGGAGGAAATGVDATFNGGDYTYAGAGGAGGTVIKWIRGLQPGTTVNIVVGNGGTSGQRGGDTVVTIGNTVLTSYGGHAFEPDGYGAGGDARGGDLNIPGSSGTDLYLVNLQGAKAAYGGASYWGGGAESGGAGHAYGAGGGGGVNGGEPGKEGVVIVEFNI
jgi:hypothetical protein